MNEKEEETRWARADRVMAERMEAFTRKWRPTSDVEAYDFRIDLQEIMLSVQRRSVEFAQRPFVKELEAYRAISLSTSAISAVAPAGRSTAAPPAAPSGAGGVGTELGAASPYASDETTREWEWDLDRRVWVARSNRGGT